MFLAILNKSEQLKASDTQMAVSACASQIKLHAAPYWDMMPASIVYYENEDQIPPGADTLVIFDDADQAGAYGYHQETPDGRPYARVFVNPILNHGGTMLSGGLSVSSTISHEACEWLVDRFTNLWAEGSDAEYAVEICDPVENDSYEIDGVSVSNFVTKRYFDHLAPTSAKFDYLGKLTKPFTMTSGGSLVVRKSGVVQQIFGDDYPVWRKDMKEFPAARSYKRRMQHG